LRQSLIKQSSLALNSWSSCFSLQNAGITAGVCQGLGLANKINIKQLILVGFIQTLWAVFQEIMSCGFKLSPYCQFPAHGSKKCANLAGRFVCYVKEK
jgi:hypothetical protein